MRIIDVSRNAVRHLALIAALFAVAGPAMAGQGGDAAVIGQVTDESGAVLPGVTVTATSPALQVPQSTTVTNEQGEYRLAPLPIGSYTVEYALSGFQTVRREQVRLTVGFVAKIDLVLKIGALTETLIVSGVAPVVDVTSTGNATQFTKETLELIPSSRNGIVGLLAQAPGVRTNIDVGGSSSNAVPQSKVFGMAGEPWSLFDGVPTGPVGEYAGNYWDYASVDEALVQTVAKDPSVPSNGVYLNAIVKSGSNAFHGQATVSDTNKHLQSNNITDSLRAQGITAGNSVDTRWDYSGELGGRIVRDTLWFYASGRRRGQTAPVLAPGVFMDNGKPAADLQDSIFQTTKLSYQMSPANRFAGFHHLNRKNDQGRVSQFIPWESRTHNLTDSFMGKIEWQAVRGNSLMMTIHYGNWRYYTNKPDHAVGKVPTLDIATQNRTGPGDAAGEYPDNMRHDIRGAATLYRPDLFLGNHEFKMGFGSNIAKQSRARPAGKHLPTYNYRLEFNNGVPFQLAAFNYPTYPKQVTHYHDVYFTDNWTIARRLTLDLGARYAHDSGFVPESCREAARPPGHVFAPAACFSDVQFAIWDSVVPRLYAAYDVTGEGKTVIKGGWGRFAHLRGPAELSPADPNVASTAFYRWNDLNRNKTYEPGEVDLNPNGPDFVRVQGIALAVPNLDEQLPLSDQLSLSLDQELFANIGVRVLGVYVRNTKYQRQRNPLRPPEVYSIPVTRPDPGLDGRVGTADDPGVSITYYEYPAELSGVRFERSTLINSNDDEVYKSVEVAGFKRLSNRWQFSAAYSATKKDIPVVGRIPADNPNVGIFGADRTWERTGKLSGAYIFPREVLVSANFEHRSGDPFARQVLFTGGRTIPSIVLNVEPIGARTLPSINLLDARVQKTIGLPRGQKLVGRVNVYNVMNASTLASTGTAAAFPVNVRSGSTFLRPLAILPPRIVEFGVTYSF